MLKQQRLHERIHARTILDLPRRKRRTAHEHHAIRTVQHILIFPGSYLAHLGIAVGDVNGVAPTIPLLGRHNARRDFLVHGQIVEQADHVLKELILAINIRDRRHER